MFPLPQLAGLIEPNVGRCNLQLIPGNQFGEYEYTRSLEEVCYIHVYRTHLMMEQPITSF